MRTPPDLPEIIHGKRGMLEGIKACMKVECLVSVITLVYSTIDAVSALTRPKHKENTESKVFINWVDQYLLPGSELSCSANDLYGARCGVLHTYSPDSGMARRGEAKPLVYRWETGPSADALVELPEGAIEICVEHLVKALKQGIRQFLDKVENNPDVNKLVRHHLSSLLCYKPWPPLKMHAAA